MATASIETQIVSLRRKIQQEDLDGIPRPKAMAKLACLLCDSAVGTTIEDTSIRKEEAYALAKRSQSSAPHKSFGYTAISVSSPDFDERMAALEKALQFMEIDALQLKGNSVEKLDLLVSMSFHLMHILIDPRDYESKQIDCSKASTRHPYRRDFYPTERIDYEKLKELLHSAKSIFIYFRDSAENMEKSAIQISVATQLAKLHYRLGIFFRKMVPESSHRSSSRWHFEQVNTFLPKSSLASKAAFWIATFSSEFGDISERTSIDRCPEEYIVSLYSTFAANFDDLLVNKLRYETPTKLRRIVDKHVSRHLMYPKGIWAAHCADLGCGTGLSGSAFRDCVQYMIGVDLSKEMIEKARLRQCYDKLVCGNLEDVLLPQSPSTSPCNSTFSYDLVIAADVFVYIGDLQSIFTLVQKRLTPGYGLFVFSTEMLEDAAGDRPFLLQPCARFSHKKSYLIQLCKSSGLHLIDIQSSIIRQNQAFEKNIKSAFRLEKGSVINQPHTQHRMQILLMTNYLYTSTLRDLPYFEEFARITDEGIHRAQEVLRPLQEPDGCEPNRHLFCASPSQMDLYFQGDGQNFSTIHLNDVASLHLEKDSYKVVDEIKLMDSFIALQNEAEQEAQTEYDALRKTRNYAKCKFQSSAVEDEQINWTETNLQRFEIISFSAHRGNQINRNSCLNVNQDDFSSRLYSCITQQLCSGNGALTHAATLYASSDNLGASALLSNSRSNYKENIDTLWISVFEAIFKSTSSTKNHNWDNSFVQALSSASSDVCFLPKNSQSTVDVASREIVSHVKTEAYKSGSVLDFLIRFRCWMVQNDEDDCIVPVLVISPNLLFKKKPPRQRKTIEYNESFALDLLCSFSMWLESNLVGLSQYYTVPDFGTNEVFIPIRAIGAVDERKITQLGPYDFHPRPTEQNELQLYITDCLKSILGVILRHHSSLQGCLKAAFRDDDDALSTSKNDLSALSSESTSTALVSVQESCITSLITKEVDTQPHRSTTSMIDAHFYHPMVIEDDLMYRRHFADLDKDVLIGASSERQTEIFVSDSYFDLVPIKNIEHIRVASLHADRTVTYTNVISGIISIQKYTRYLFLSKNPKKTNVMILGVEHAIACKAIQKQYRQWKLKKKLKEVRTSDFGYSDKDWDISWKNDLDDMFHSISNLIFDVGHEDMHASSIPRQHLLDDGKASINHKGIKNSSTTSGHDLVESSRRPKISVNEIMTDWKVTNVTLAKNILKRKNRITNGNHNEATKGNRYLRSKDTFIEPQKNQRR